MIDQEEETEPKEEPEEPQPLISTENAGDLLVSFIIYIIYIYNIQFP